MSTCYRQFPVLCTSFGAATLMDVIKVVILQGPAQLNAPSTVGTSGPTLRTHKSMHGFYVWLAPSFEPLGQYEVVCNV